MNTGLFTKIFLLFPFLIFIWSEVSIIVPESDFLEDAKVSPAKLEFFRDSIRFSVKGTIPIESAINPRNPQLKISIKSSDQMLDLGEVELRKTVSHYEYEKGYNLPYSPWMEGAFLEAQFFHGKKKSDVPNEIKILAKGVITTPLLAKVGVVNADEPIPQVGLYIPTGIITENILTAGEFLFRFDPGSSSLKLNGANQKSLTELKTFITENPSIVSFKITGIQSPEVSEGKSSKLGMDRSVVIQKRLKADGIVFRDSLMDIKSRWNDWFDFRLLLRDYEKISTQRKDQYYSILLNGTDYPTQSQQLKKIPGFDQVSRELFPKLRATKVEILAKPVSGLDQEQSASLKEALRQKEGNYNTLDQLDWAIAGETSPRLEDKAEIYSKMTELFRSALPYNNLAVVKMRQAQRTLEDSVKSRLWIDAYRLLEQALKIETNPYVLHNQGQILIFQGKTWEAYTKLSAASGLTRNPEFLKYNESLRGALDIMRGDYKLAILRFDYLFSEPGNLFNKGLAYFLAKDYANASLSFEESVMAGRNYGYGYYGLALVAALSGQDEVALIQLQKAIESSEQIYQKALIDPVFEELRQKKDFFEIFKSKGQEN
ncbi:MAG: tetratricopeptide repeat protein [Algoriphagus sp.]|nr:tetratricopeptide repeat protein [Algoriphagus sp.]